MISLDEHFDDDQGESDEDRHADGLGEGGGAVLKHFRGTGGNLLLYDTDGI